MLPPKSTTPRPEDTTDGNRSGSCFLNRACSLWSLSTQWLAAPFVGADQVHAPMPLHWPRSAPRRSLQLAGSYAEEEEEEEEEEEKEEEEGEGGEGGEGGEAGGARWRLHASPCPPAMLGRVGSCACS